MRNNSVPLKSLAFALALLVFNIANAQVTTLSEGFDQVVPNGWASVNHSSSTGLTWFQGDVRQFSSHSGIQSSYAAAGYQSLSAAHGTINNWLISPELDFQSGGAISFYTRTIGGSTFADRLEVRLSINGSSTNIGSGPEGTGDFSILILSINPSLADGGYPDTGWTKYTVYVAGLPGLTSGRVAFRYYVADGGSDGTNSNYIGIDDFSYGSVLPVKILGFKGLIANNKALLSWSTADETNSKGFEVEMSRDNHNFSSIGFIASAQSKTGGANYSFTDDKLLSGTNYYRLKQIDNDGNSKYSSVVKLDYKNFAWSIIGNSAGNNPYVQLQLEQQSNVVVQVISSGGRIIKTINKGNTEAGTYNIPLSLDAAPHGIYIVKLIANNNSYSKKLVK